MTKNYTWDQVALATDLIRCGTLPRKLEAAVERVLLAALTFREPDATGEGIEDGSSDSRSAMDDVGGAEVRRGSSRDLGRSLSKSKAALVKGGDTHGSVPSSEGSDKSVKAAGTRRDRRFSKR